MRCFFLCIGVKQLFRGLINNSTEGISPGSSLNAVEEEALAYGSYYAYGYDRAKDSSEQDAALTH